MIYADPQPNITSVWRKMTPSQEFDLKIIPLCAVITGLVKLGGKSKTVERQIEKYTAQLVKLLKTKQPIDENCYHYSTNDYSVTLEPTGLLKINNDAVIFTDPNHKILTVDEIQKMAAVTTQVADQPVNKPVKNTNKITPKKLGYGLMYSDIYSGRKTVMYDILAKAMKLGKAYSRYYQDAVRSADYEPMRLFRLLQLQEQNETVINTFEELNCYSHITASLSQQRYTDSGIKAGNTYAKGMAVWIESLLAMFKMDHTETDASVREQYRYTICVPTKTYISNIFETADAINLCSMSFDTPARWGNRNKPESVMTIKTMLEFECDKPSYDMLDLREYKNIFEYPLRTAHSDNTNEYIQLYNDYIADLKSCINKITVWLHGICDNNPVIRQILIETAIYDGELETSFKTPYLFKNHNDVHELAPSDIQLLNMYVEGNRWKVQPEDIATDTDLFETVKVEYMNDVLLTHGVNHVLNIDVLFNALAKLDLIN